MFEKESFVSDFILCFGIAIIFLFVFFDFVCFFLITFFSQLPQALKNLHNMIL